MAGKLEVGQKLWFVPKNGKPHEIVVEKVGRKWADVGQRGRLDIDRMVIMDGDFRCGEVHLNREEWEAETRRDRAWDALRRGAISRYSPRGLSLENIVQAASLLGIDLPDTKADTKEG